MPDGAQLLDRSSHVDLASFSTPSTALRMDYRHDSRPPPPGIVAPASSSSRTAAIGGSSGLAHDHNAPPSSLNFPSSLPLPHANHTAFAAPRPMQPYPRLMSPQPVGESAAPPASSSEARPPSPTKRSFNFAIGDPGERWNSISQVSSNTIRGSAITSQRKPSLHSGLSASSTAAEPFLGYNELCSPNGTSSLTASEASKGANAAALSTSDPMNVAFRSGSSTDSRTGFTLSTSHEQDLISHRFGLSPGHYAAAARDDFPSQMGGGNPRSGTIGNAAGIATQGGPPEEITTVFIVGFPDDMTEREFANMFLFAKGFEASTLKIPAGLGAIGPNGRLSDGSGPLSAGPGGPYQAVNMPGFDLGGNAGPGWDEQSLPLGLGRAGASDPFSSLASMPGMPNSLGAPGLGSAGGVNSASAAAAAGKIKQIIGFAKFRTRAEALEARDALNGRKVDVEKGCVLKTEMAKKNLHTKQRPVLSAPGFAEGGSAPIPPPPGIGAIGSATGTSGAAASQPAPPPFALGGPFDPRAGPQIHGPGGQAAPFAPFGKGPGSFEPFNGPTSTPGDLLSPHEMFGGPDFFSQAGPAALRSSLGTSGGVDQSTRLAAPSQQASTQQQQQQQSSAGAEKWGGSIGPIDYYGPESGAAPVPASSRGLQGGDVAQGFNAQSGPRPDWPAVGSPPPGLYSAVETAGAAGGGPQRPGFQRQGSRGTEQAATGPGFATAPGSVSKLEEGAKADNSRSSSMPSSAGPEAVAAAAATTDAQQSSVTTRFGSLKLGPPPADDDGVKPPQRASSPDLASPTVGRNVVGDNHPPVNTLFVGNLPSNASSVVIAQIEDQLRAVFGSCRGFRQISFRLKSNGPMCFVEFEDVYSASKAMSELNGHSLGGAIKNGGIRLSFSKNPLFRMNSNSAMNAAMNGAGTSGGSSGSNPSSGSVA
ncbi:hypothetical protein [Sporisorium scitamineum]|uniref:RRM domain-containing protein n=1 Tax=Sporisorium scitamineum TaxID=49012 RepID=A0A0F7RSH1_9BASI|nr:hypothetical protein [Sporisorium scitamineum]